MRNLVVGTVPLFVTALAVYACSDDTTSGGAAAQDAGSTADSSVTANPPPAATDGAADAATTTAVTLMFEGRVGSEKFACGSTYTGIGTSNAEAKAADFRFFIHDVKLLKGTTEVPLTLDVAAPWQSDRIALLDFENKTGACANGTTATNDKVTGTVPAGTYNGIVFNVGVPDDLNHVNADIAEAPLPNSALQWDWTNGFIHFALELDSTAMVDGGDGIVPVPPFYSHIGSTFCSGEPGDGGGPTCEHKNRPTIRLTGFDPATSKVIVDAKKILAGSNIDVNTDGTIPGCMSSATDPECPAVFNRLGIEFDAGTPMEGQTAFSVEPR